MRTPVAVLRRLDPGERFPVRLGGAAAGLLLVAVPGSLLVISVVGRWAPLASWDTSVAESVHRVALEHASLRAVAGGITHFGDTVTRAVVTVLGVGLLLRRGAIRSAVFLGTVVPLGSLIGTLTKLAVDRARPVLPEPFAHADGTSFPSGHAMGSTVLYGALLLTALPLLPAAVRPLVRWLAAALVLAVGVSRVVLGVHYPSDVAGGWLIGLAWLLVAVMIFNRWRVETGEPPVEDPTKTGIEPEDASRG